MNKIKENSARHQEKKTEVKTDKQSETKEQPKKDDKKLDPTHFGDWQVNCRTIDF